MCNRIPESIRNVSSLNIFKAENKNPNPDLCTCGICKTYIERVGFI